MGVSETFYVVRWRKDGKFVRAFLFEGQAKDYIRENGDESTMFYLPERKKRPDKDGYVFPLYKGIPRPKILTK